MDIPSIKSFIIDINNTAANLLFNAGRQPAMAQCGAVTPPIFSLPIIDARPDLSSANGPKTVDMENGEAAKSPLEYQTKIKLGKLMQIYEQYPFIKDKSRLISEISRTYMMLFRNKIFGMGKLSRKSEWLFLKLDHMDINKMDGWMLELLSCQLKFKLSVSYKKRRENKIPQQVISDISERANRIEEKLQMLKGNGWSDEKGVFDIDIKAGDFVPAEDIPRKADNLSTQLAALRIRKYEIRLAFALDPKKRKDFGLLVEMASIHLDSCRIMRQMHNINGYAHYDLIQIANSYAESAHEQAPDDKNVLRLHYDILLLKKDLCEQHEDIEKVEIIEKTLKNYRSLLGIQEEYKDPGPIEIAMINIEAALAVRDLKEAERRLMDELGLGTITPKKMKSFCIDKAFISQELAERLKELNMDESEFREMLAERYFFAFNKGNKFHVYITDSGVLYRVFVTEDEHVKKVQYIRECGKMST